jgi:hypothetical protein
MPFSISNIIAGSWNDWQQLMTMLTSVLNLLALPYTIAGFRLAWKRSLEQPAPLIVHFTFWITFIAVVGGNIIIHERYRLMMTLLLFASAWFGYTSCSREQIRQSALPWFQFLGASAVFFVVYKSM